MSLSWLDNLRKTSAAPAPAPAPARLNEHSDMFATTDSDGSRIVAKRDSKVVEDGFDSADDYLMKAANERHGIPANLEKRAKVRVVYGDANDTRKVASTDVTDYSGTRLIAEKDEQGRIFRIVEETKPDHVEKNFSFDPPSEGFVEEKLAKVLGVGLADIHAEYPEEIFSKR